MQASSLSDIPLSLGQKDLITDPWVATLSPQLGKSQLDIRGSTAPKSEEVIAKPACNFVSGPQRNDLALPRLIQQKTRAEKYLSNICNFPNAWAT